MDITKITYREIENHPTIKGEGITKVVMEARAKAYEDAEKMADSDKVQEFRFAPVDGYPGGPEKMYHVVTLPKALMDDTLHSEMSRDEFNKWEQSKSIYEISLIRDLSTRY